ncbi:UDP-glycosyltransferase 71B2 [Forsythia ovata]|uniref:UDP-glycosyltransferase 71B2 n=1 Tax=Forsythia ovata TaxID=205694 RepID=A0ABD1XBH4_9LAMI
MNLLRPEFYWEDSDMLLKVHLQLLTTFGIDEYYNATFRNLVQVITNEFKQDITEFKDDANKELLIPGFVNPMQVKVLPTTMLDKSGGRHLVMSTARTIRGCKGIMFNTFLELETNAIISLSSDGKILRVFPVGPLINLKQNLGDDGDIMGWLDNQPTSSVVFFCFGSLGSFNGQQVKEIDVALEHIGYRFLLSLR